MQKHQQKHTQKPLEYFFNRSISSECQDESDSDDCIVLKEVRISESLTKSTSQTSCDRTATVLTNTQQLSSSNGCSIERREQFKTLRVTRSMKRVSSQPMTGNDEILSLKQFTGKTMKRLKSPQVSYRCC